LDSNYQSYGKKLEGCC